MSWALWCLVTIVLFHRVWPDAKLTGLRMALSANHRWHISRRQRLQSVRRLGSAGSWLKLRGWITGHRGLLQMQQVVSGHQPGNKRVVALADGSMLFVEQLSSLADPWAPYSPMGRAIHCQQWRDAPHYAQHLEDQQQASSFKQRCSRARVLMQGIGTGDRVRSAQSWRACFFGTHVPSHPNATVPVAQLLMRAAISWTLTPRGATSVCAQRSTRDLGKNCIRSTSQTKNSAKPGKRGRCCAPASPSRESLRSWPLAFCIADGADGLPSSQPFFGGSLPSGGCPVFPVPDMAELLHRQRDLLPRSSDARF